MAEKRQNINKNKKSLNKQKYNLTIAFLLLLFERTHQQHSALSNPPKMNKHPQKVSTPHWVE
jgi:SLT domain-containing protein